ncbi:DUF5994 family protein [Actinomycetospora soli]|uniref:DUF5994 family protein n=1 Tax=Actinomycetospora soli TaxID=2893887 RepID=UPI001E3CE2D2|nr:DUF5994 family protein [Actinomycetospora soli]MCD2185761.1 DUF5994 family protein [Actinomycetospora soli]
MSPAPDTTTARTRLKPPGPATGFVDGAWWPRSEDLAAELPPLLEDVHDRGDVARVAYHLDDWTAAPRRLAPGRVRLEGFRTTAPHSVTLVGPAGLRLVLLVIPSSTPEGTAEAAMTAAAAPDDRRSPADLLDGAETAP